MLILKHMQTHQYQQTIQKSYIIGSNPALAMDLLKFQEVVNDSREKNSEALREESGFMFKQMAEKLPFDIYRRISDSWGELEKNPDSLLAEGTFNSCCRQAIQQLKNGYVWSCNQ